MSKKEHYTPSYEEIEKTESAMTEEERILSMASAEAGAKEEQGKFREFEEGCVPLETKSFSFMVPEGFELPGEAIEKQELMKEKLEEFFGIKVEHKIPVSVIYERGTGGRISAHLDPRETRIIVAVRKGEKIDEDYWNKIFSHEIAHIAAQHWTGNHTHPVTSYLDDGLAEYLARERFGQEFFGSKVDYSEESRKFLKAHQGENLEKYLSFDNIFSIAYGEEDKTDAEKEIPYVLGPSLTKMLFKRFDREQVRQLYKYAIEGPDYAGGSEYNEKWMRQNFARVVEEKLGVSIKELEEMWKEEIEEG